MATHWVIGDTVLLETRRTAKHYVYALLADDEVPFYVGKTCDPSARLKQHVYSGVPAVAAKLRECKLKRMRILAGPMSEREAEGVEKATVQAMGEAGVQLVNQASQPAQKGGASRHPTVLRFAGFSSD
jgi:predicted GIY-YIG superfamily endonuclease